MANALRAEQSITPEEYLEAEKDSLEKHEYLAGAIYMMAGASTPHIRITGSISRHLGNQLSGKSCETFSTDMKVYIRHDFAEFYYYPDVIVDCSNHTNPQGYTEEPRVIFEVMSPSTARTDQNEKLSNYQTLASLDVYVLVDQSRVAVTIYRRENDEWKQEFYNDLNDTVALPTIECELSLTDIYERTGLENEGN